MPESPWARPLVIGAFFVTVVIRTGVAAFRLPTRRGLPLTMAAGLALFGTGSLVLALNPGLGFPSFAEAIFGAAYLCFTGFLILDTSVRGVWTLRAVLETGVIAGGIISGALFALVIPLAARVTGGGLPLLIALVYPIADVVLITILLTQLVTGRKPRSRRSALLVGGLCALAAVDISLPFGLGGGGYAFSTLQDVVWAIALAMLAAGASRPSGTAKRSRADIGPSVAVAAALCALVVLATNSGPTLTWLIRTPAVLTMVLSLALLLSSLRDARLAIEAQRLSRTDDLTGLGNRRAVVERLTGAEGATGCSHAHRPERVQSCQ